VDGLSIGHLQHLINKKCYREQLLSPNAVRAVLRGLVTVMRRAIMMMQARQALGFTGENVSMGISVSLEKTVQSDVIPLAPGLIRKRIALN
jgi:hypothetical protein